MAVLPVILFHAGFGAFGGGFVGVDVFFVISGYLITTIILAELEQGRFSLVRFYERRARRILPALFVVMFCCLPFAWFWLLPSDMRSFAQSLVAVSVFASNILFWQTADYFDTAAELKPLLHTWSLAVEEQYYLLFPLLLLVTWRLGRRWVVGLLALVFVASLAAAQWGSLARPAATFYLLPTRGWELLVGAFAAFYCAKRGIAQARSWLAEGGGLLGVALIAVSILCFTAQTPFPGLYALVPTLGTALIIVCAHRRTFVGRWLGSQALVMVGLVSYSAYLWHQPLFAFARQRSLTEPGPWVMAGLCLAVIPLATLSWRFVERPFRGGQRFTRRQVFACGLLVSVFFVAIGLAGHLARGNLQRGEHAQRMDALEARVSVNRGLSADCEWSYTDSPACRTDDQPEVMLWGDSNAMQLVDGLLASRAGLRLVQSTVSFCGPAFDVAPIFLPNYGKEWAANCIATNDKVQALLRQQPSIRYVVLGSAFVQYIGPGARLMNRDGSIVEGATHAFDAFDKTLQTLQAMGKVPVVVSPVPSRGSNIGRCLLKAERFDLPASSCDFPEAEALVHQKALNDFLVRIGRNHKVVFLADGICEGGICRASVGDTLVYRDGGHLSREGSAHVGRKMNLYGLLAQPR